MAATFTPRYLARSPISAAPGSAVPRVPWRARWRAGRGTRGRRTWSAGWIRSRSGSPKAAVFPVPVLERQIRSRPSSTGRYALAWTGVGCAYPRSATARRTSGESPRSSKPMSARYSCGRSAPAAGSGESPGVVGASLIGRGHSLRVMTWQQSTRRDRQSAMARAKKTGSRGSGRAKRPPRRGPAKPAREAVVQGEVVEATEPAEPAEPAESAPEELEEGVPEVGGATSALARPAPVPSTPTRDALQAYMAEVNRHPLLTREEEHELAVHYRDTGDVKAAYTLVAANLRLVVKLAHEYHRNPLALLDLVQEGNIGLMQAVKKYDPDRGVKLSSYAAWWIRAYILRYIMDNWKMVKLGTTEAQRKLFFKLRQEQDRLTAQGYEVTPKLLADRLNVTEQDVVEMDQRLSHDELSLDAPLREDDDRTTRADRLVP